MREEMGISTAPAEEKRNNPVTIVYMGKRKVIISIRGIFVDLNRHEVVKQRKIFRKIKKPTVLDIKGLEFDLTREEARDLVKKFKIIQKELKK